MDKRRPPEHLREKLDLNYRFEKQSVILFEIRPLLGRPNEIIEHAFAKASWVKSQEVWKVYWMRGNLKWYPYDPPAVEDFEQFLTEVDEDRLGCFWG